VVAWGVWVLKILEEIVVGCNDNLMVGACPDCRRLHLQSSWCSKAIKSGFR
jgi:hypothetical protein